MAALAVAAAARPAATGSTRRLVSAVRSPAPRRLRLVLGASCVPKAEDSHGEDAYFASHPLGAFGLADGVGGWSREGVDSGLFSRALLRNVHAELKRRSDGLSGLPNLPDTARAAFGAVREAEILGSSTLLLAQLHMNMLSVLNLGDCGILAFRPMLVQPRFVGGTPEPALRLLYRSSPMLHRPNFPLQLSSHDQDASTALEALDLVSVRLMKGDLVVAGTDGLFDNIRDLALKSMVLELQADHALHRDPSAFVSKLAATIARRAGDIARVPDEFAGGGKLDDIAVVVARAEDAGASISGELLDNLSHGSAGGARPASS